MSLGEAMSPNGGVESRRVMEERPLDTIPVKRVVITVDVDSISG